MAAPAPGADSKESAADKKSPPKSPPSNFYGYLFDATKAPTRTLENLLRAIGKHIIAEIGDKNTETLTPPKLAAFYKAVGGNYDSLFVNVPYQSISFIWQFTGCQYSLQPVEGKDYEPPSIPALTLRGFVRWQSIEILLGPEEHVPFIQHAVKHWALKNPDTGEPFPTDLPKEAFPAATDPDIDKWHKSCAAKLKQQAEPASARRSFGDHPRPHSSERAEPKARMPYAHLRNPNSETPLNARPGPDYFARPVRAVPGRVPSQRVQVPLSPERTRFHPGSSSDERARRRSLSDHPSPQADGSHGFKHLHPERPAGPARRHSQPRHASSSDSISDSDDASPPMRHRPGSGPEDNGRRRPGSVRHVPAGGHSAPSGSSQPHLETRPHRADDPRKRSLPFTVPEVIRDKFDKVSAFVSNGRSPDRHRSASGRRDRERDREREIARRNREHLVASKLRGSWEDLDADASDGSDSSVQRHTRMKLRRAEKDAQIREDELRFRERERDRERERERERGRDRGRTRQDRERDWERERERDEELETRKRRDRERFLQRPEVHRRTSSHADIDRMREEAWDPRDRDFRDEKRRWKEREPAVSPVTGVSGRRYPAEPVWN